MKALIGRLQEPSSYSAFAILFYVFFPDTASWEGMAYLKEVATALLAGAGFMMKEKK